MLTARKPSAHKKGKVFAQYNLCVCVKNVYRNIEKHSILILVSNFVHIFWQREIIICCFLLSLPLRERGLKCCHVSNDCLDKGVAPLAGAWVEMS